MCLLEGKGREGIKTELKAKFWQTYKVCVCVCVFVCHCLATKVLYRLIASYWMGGGDHEVYTQGVKGNHRQTN